MPPSQYLLWGMVSFVCLVDDVIHPSHSFHECDVTAGQKQEGTLKPLLTRHVDSSDTSKQTNYVELVNMYRLPGSQS